MFNDKVRAMNQTQSRDLVLTAQEARSLHSDIFNLLAKLAQQESGRQPVTDATASKGALDLDGGNF